MLLKRILTTLIGLPIIIAAVWFQQPVPWFTILITVWAAIAAWEFFRLNRKAGIKPLPYFGTAMAILFVLVWESNVISFSNTSSEKLIPVLFSISILLPLVWLLNRKPRNEAFARWAWTLAGISYVGFLMGYLVGLRNMVDGRNWVFFALLITYASDTAAFFIGRNLGRHKLAAAVSPAKTWEGAIGGLSGAVLVSLIFIPTHIFSWVNPLHITVLQYWSTILLALLVSVIGQIGDLIESLFKRNMGAKDSGNILPGHGGALDRIDSVAFAGIMVYYFVWLIQ